MPETYNSAIAALRCRIESQPDAIIELIERELAKRLRHHRRLVDLG